MAPRWTRARIGRFSTLGPSSLGVDELGRPAAARRQTLESRRHVSCGTRRVNWSRPLSAVATLPATASVEGAERRAEAGQRHARRGLVFDLALGEALFYSCDSPGLPSWRCPQAPRWRWPMQFGLSSGRPRPMK
jgi:hypothetical protein